MVLGSNKRGEHERAKRAREVSPRRLKKELAQAEERFELLFENAPDCIYTTDLKGHFLDGNRAAETLVGYRREQLIGQSFLKLDLLQKKDLPRAARLLALNALGQAIGPEEFTLNRQDGSQVKAEIRSIPARIAGKRVVIGIARDITERRRAEAQLRREKAYLDQLFETARLAIVMCDMEGLVQRVNRVFCEMFHHRAEEAVGRHIDALVTREDSREDSQEDARTLTDKVRAGSPIHWEGRRYRSDGLPIEVSLQASPIIVEGRQVGIYAMYQDLTERNRTQQALKSSNEELAQFIYTASHDLKTPVVSITGYLGMLEEMERERLSDRGRQVLERMEQACQQMRTLLDDLARFTRVDRQTYQPGPVEVGPLLEGLRRDMRADLERTGARLVIPRVLPTLRADEAALEQVFATLLHNALRYMPEGTEPVVELRYEQEDDVHHFQVQDNGIGVEPRYQERIFEPFCMLKDPRAGRVSSSGLGLSIAARILEHHQGRIWMESDGRTGSAFHFSLPMRPLPRNDDQSIILVKQKGET